MPGLNRTTSQNADSGSSSHSEVYASATSNESRGRSKLRDPTRPRRSSEARAKSTTKSGYHVFEAFGKQFCIEKRWKFIRELGSGAYGHVVSVQDEITGEILAVKMVTRIFEKVQLAKRALREITLLRHFNNHENITGLIDMDVSGPDFNEIYLFMEPMEADLYQIIRSGQTLTDAHIRFFMYQLLRGVKYIHSADVIHRDLKPGNLLVNSDCELKICDMGLSRGYDSKKREDEPGGLTEYVATRWYRAPEIMLSFKSYNTAIDMWSVGCILGELLGGKPLFKGKDYVDQLNQILGVLGTPSEETIERIGSSKAKSYIRAYPIKKATPWAKLFPSAHPLALDLISKLLTFDPKYRLTVDEALAHPWLSSYHDLNEYPDDPPIFDRWREVEALDTTDEFRTALYKEVMEFREEVRNIAVDTALDDVTEHSEYEDALDESALHPAPPPAPATTNGTVEEPVTATPLVSEPVPFPTSEAPVDDVPGAIPSPSTISRFSKDPYRAYARRTSIFSIHNDRSVSAGPSTAVVGEEGSLDRAYAYPTSRSRIQSSDTLGPAAATASVMPRFLRQLSTVSISDIADANRATGIVAMAKGPDAPVSELPSEWARKSSAGQSSGGS